MSRHEKDLVSFNLKPDEHREQDDVKLLSLSSLEKVELDRAVISESPIKGMLPFNTKDEEKNPGRYVLTGIQEHSRFSTAFFSVANMKWIHSAIRYEVYTKSDNVISKQRDSDLLESMRRIFLQNSRNPQDTLGVKKELIRLNNLVLSDIVPRIVSEISHHSKYLKDIEKVRTPVSLPVNTSVVGTKMYSSNRQGPADIFGLEV